MCGQIVWGVGVPQRDRIRGNARVRPVRFKIRSYRRDKCSRRASCLPALALAVPRARAVHAPRYASVSSRSPVCSSLSPCTMRARVDAGAARWVGRPASAQWDRLGREATSLFVSSPALLPHETRPTDIRPSVLLHSITPRAKRAPRRAGSWRAPGSRTSRSRGRPRRRHGPSHAPRRR